MEIFPKVCSDTPIHIHRRTLPCIFLTHPANLPCPANQCLPMFNHSKTTENDPNRLYFLAFATHGCGGESGWGVIVNEMEGFFNQVGQIVDEKMNYLAAVEKRNARNSFEK